MLDFQFNEGHGLTSASSVGSAVLTLGQAVDLSNDPKGSTDTPSGATGDLSGEFNGIGWGYATFDEAPIDLTKPVTWEAWVNVDAERVDNYEEYFRIGNTFKMGADADHFFEVTLAGVVDIPSTIVQMSAGGGWSHVAAVWEPGVGVTFFQEGAMMDFVEATQLPNAYGNKIISIGSNNSGGNNFKGKLDRTRIYNRALTDTELDSDPANPKPIGDAVLAWDFNQETLPFTGAGSKAVDITSGLAMIGDRTQIAWSDSTPARDADPELLGDFSVFVDNKGSGDYANKYGVFDCDAIDFGDPSAADFDASFTLEAWFKGLSKSALKQVFFQTWSSTTGRCPRLAFAIYTDFTVYITTMGVMDIYTGAKIPEDGGWHHIACTFDQKNQKLITYVDGKVASETPRNNNASGDPLSNWNVNFATQGSDSHMGVIGAEHSTYAPFTGYVDRMRFWKGVLTKDQLDYQHYDAYVPAEVVEDPQNVSVPSNLGGAKVTLTAKAVGSDPLTYQWFRSNGEPIEGATSTSLDVIVTEDTIGGYYMEATNDTATSRSNPAVISWGAPLSIGSKLVLDYQFTEGPGNYTTASSVGNVSAVLGTEYDPAHHPSTSADSPSGAAGDNAVVFDGTGYLRGWTDQLYYLTQPFTMETWVYIDPDSTKGYEGFATYGQTLKIGCTSDHYFVFTMSGVEDVKSSIPVDPINGWQHLAAAWTPGVGVTFYFNGMEWETIETTNMPRAAAKEVINGGEVYRITVGAEAGGNPTQGMLDRVRVHQAVLTADQLDSDPANPKPVRADTLFAFDFNKETEMPYSSTTTPVIVLNEDPAEGAAEAATVQWSEDSPSGKEGNYSLYFNGSQQATMPADYLQFDRTDPSFTVEAWVKGEPQSNRQIIFSNNGPGARFSFSIASDYSVFATLYGVVDIGSGAMIPQDGKWHHIAFCHDYTDKMLLFYVDGALSDFGSYSGAMAFDGNWTTSYIGSEGGNYYKGNIARLRVHTGVLDPRNLDYYSIDRRVAPEIVSLNIPAVVAGEKATMSVEATGSQPMTYQWFLNGVAIEGATSREYTIEEATLADAGAYTVKVTNDEAGVTSDPEALVVSSAPGSLVKLVDFQMDERSGNTTASTVGGAVATWDADLVPVIHSSETPSGLLGDYSVEFAGNGFLIGDLGNNALPLDKGFTWESWVYRAVDGQGSYEDFIRIGNSIKVGLNTAKVFQGTFLGVVDLNSNATLETGVWYHLAVAWEPGVGVHFYVNGEDAGTVADTRAPNALQNNLMTLAADNGGGCKFWGKLDRTRVHLGVLTAEQLDCEAANPKPVTENTIFDYQFNAILTDADGDEYFESNGQADVAEYIAGARATTWTDGPYGVFHLGTTLVDSALKCAGAPALFNTDGIDFGDTTDLSYSLEAWVKDVPKSASRQVFFMVPGNEAGTAPRVSFSVGANHTIFSTALGVVDYDSGVEIPTDSEWHHIVLAFNMNAQLVSIYLDGQLAAAKKYTYGLSLSANSNNGSLGAEYNGGLPFYGTVDRVKLWKGVLGPESMDYPPAEPLAPVPPVGDLELSYSIEGADLVLRWAAETGASLEVAPTADSANWTILQGELVGGAYQCKVPMTEAAGFYRLVK
ncbi:MAG: immunoglobulin domain-containing protein [Verrucomicrobia bacterium]|nr:immunoglobulin domain-containing protein [Verrucomicrobiota bacterium]